MAEGGGKRRTLFFALWPNDATRSYLGRLAHSVVERKRGREVPHPNLHMTLLYLGPVEVDRQEEIISQVPPFDLPPFSLQIDKAGFWRKSGVIWLGMSDSPDGLMSLVVSITEVMHRAGFDLDERPFRPHVTLMRKATRGLGRVEIEPLEWRVDAFSLMESRPVPGGISYRELKSWSLKKTSLSSA